MLGKRPGKWSGHLIRLRGQAYFILLFNWLGPQDSTCSGQWLRVDSIRDNWPLVIELGMDPQVRRVLVLKRLEFEVYLG